MGISLIIICNQNELVTVSNKTLQHMSRGTVVLTVRSHLDKIWRHYQPHLRLHFGVDTSTNIHWYWPVINRVSGDMLVGGTSVRGHFCQGLVGRRPTHATSSERIPVIVQSKLVQQIKNRQKFPGNRMQCCKCKCNCEIHLHF